MDLIFFETVFFMNCMCCTWQTKLRMSKITSRVPLWHMIWPLDRREPEMGMCALAKTLIMAAKIGHSNVFSFVRSSSVYPAQL